MITASVMKGLNGIFLPFFLTEKHEIWILNQKTFVKKECFKTLCKKSCENIFT